MNQIILDSTDDLAGVARNIALSLPLYAGQMCTMPVRPGDVLRVGLTWKKKTARETENHGEVAGMQPSRTRRGMLLHSTII